MLRNYLLIAWRNFTKNTVFSLINLSGLAIGMVICLLILQFVHYERSYDQFHTNKENIYRVRLDRYSKGELSTQWAAGCAAVGPALKANFPEVQDFSTLYKTDGVVRFEEQLFREEDIYFATPSTLQLFSFEMKEGNPATALSEPFKAVLTESAVKKYFGEQDPVGKQISIDGEWELLITGVLADIPPNSHLQFDFLISFSSWVAIAGPEVETAWQWDGYLTYAQVQPQTDVADLANKLNAYVKTEEAEELTQTNHKMDFSFQPITDIHLYSHFMSEAGPNGNGQSVSFLSIIAIFVLLIAWVNYINLSTAKSMQRAKEVGMRKASGATRLQLIGQFLLESLLLNFLAGVIALTLYQLSQQLLLNLTGIPASSVLWDEFWFWPAFLSIIILGACLSGLYPAFVLSAFRPAIVLKGSLSGFSASGGKGASFFSLRKGLVVFQFMASVVLITGTLAVYQQLMFMQNHDLGLNIDQTLIVKGPNVTDSTLVEKLAAFQTELLKNPNIHRVAASNSIPGDPASRNAGGVRKYGAPESESKQYQNFFADRNFIDFYELKIIAGRKFAEERMRDTSTVIFNEIAVKHMGFENPEEAIGAYIYFWGNRLRIIGVVEDFHIKSMKELTLPTIIRYAPYVRTYQSLKVQTDGLHETLPYIEEQYAHLFPGNPFEFFFLDDYFDAQYKSELSFGKVFGLFTLLAILVACMGLFGLASFTILARTKEIGVRKVLGANLSSLLLLLSKEFIQLVFVSGLMALPITYFGIQYWLNGFPYQTPLDFVLFLFPIFIILLIASITVSIQVLKTARKNPVEALRYE